MSAEDCKRCNGPPSLTKEHWEEWWPIIKDLYWKKGKKLPEIRQIMHEQHNFHCKERQYKTKFNNKENDQPSKRLRSEQYQAMATVASAYGTQTVSFKAWRGQRQVTVTIQQIHKELGRCRKRDTGSQRQGMSLSEARAILAEKNIQEELGLMHISSQDTPGLPPQLDTPSSPDGSDSGLSAASPIDSPTTPTNCHPLLASSPASYRPYIVEHGERGLSLAGMDVLMSQHTLSEYPNTYQFSFLNSPTALKACPPLSLTTDRLGQFSVDRGLPPPQAPLNDEKQRTIKWAQSFYLKSFAAENYSLHDLTKLKAEAIQDLKATLMVDPANQYILPCLNEVATVLGTNEKWAQLEEFLRESCVVIDGVECDDSPLTIPFRYALAACVDDSKAKALYGSKLQRTHDYMVPRYGKKHPNVLINCYYWAWHLHHEYQLYDDVINILLSRLYITLQQEGKYLDGHNLMIVNCMVMLGTAYARTQQHEVACNTFEQALWRLCPHRYLSAYRMVILLGLAESRAKLGDLPAAESRMNEVIQGRIEIFGYSSQLTWAAIETFYDILKSTRQEHAADAMYRHHTQQYARQQDRQWYLDRNLDVPPGLQIPSDRSAETWSAALPTRSQDQPLQAQTEEGRG